LIKQCHSIEIPVQNMLDKLESSASTSANQDKVFHGSILPFIKAVVRELCADDSSMKSSGIQYQQIVQKLINLYIFRYVKPEPRPSLNWSRPRASSCRCKDCDVVNAFLANPDKIIGRFPMGTARRHHLHVQLEPHSDLRRETIRTSNPNILQVTKTNKTYTQGHGTWKQRAYKAIAKIKDLGPQSSMETILGADFYRRVINLDKVFLETSGDVVIGQKRAARTSISGEDDSKGRAKTWEVIDLTE